MTTEHQRRVHYTTPSGVGSGRWRLRWRGSFAAAWKTCGARTAAFVRGTGVEADPQEEVNEA